MPLTNSLYQAAFPNADAPYQLLPFRFIEFSTNDVCAVTDLGEFIFLTKRELLDFTNRAIPKETELYHDLRAKQFLVDNETQSLLDVYAVKYRTKKSALGNMTQLHMIVPTLRCNHSCHYCQVSRVSEDKIKFDMSQATAEKTADLILQAPAQNLTIEIQGGEPLLNYPIVKHFTEYIAKKNVQHGKHLDFVVCTNLSILSDDMFPFFKQFNYSISTSLDGPKDLHNQNRATRKNDSYEMFVTNLARVRNELGIDKVSALMTTSKHSLKSVRSIIDEYVAMDFRSIFLRSLNPYGFASKLVRQGTYSMDDFLSFYFEGLDYIIALNKTGINLSESFAKLILTKILTPFSTNFVDLDSPTGAGFGAMLYNYDGDVYPADEARMLSEVGDKVFKVGNVHDLRSFKDIFKSQVMKNIYAAGCAETLPGCSDCAFQPYCGADPVNNYTTQGNIFGQRPTSDRCHKQLEITKYLLNKIRTKDPDVLRVFMSWVTEGNVKEALNWGAKE